MSMHDFNLSTELINSAPLQASFQSIISSPHSPCNPVMYNVLLYHVLLPASEEIKFKKRVALDTRDPKSFRDKAICSRFNILFYSSS
jgi:hypothetical protein